MSLGRIFLVLLVLLAAGQLAHRAWVDRQLSEPGFHAQDCWFETPYGRAARCGLLTVAENRDNPASRTIRLPVVVFAAAEPDPDKAPILYLTGGPGGHAYLGEQDFIDGWWEEQQMFPAGHDFIVLGQRGTGLEEPDFDCEEFVPAEVGLAAHRRGDPPPDQRTLFLEAAEACAQRLGEDGIDLTAYNSRESADDVAELRLALGIGDWHLYGVSYGTRLALSTLRYRPEGIRSVILDSVFPPEASALTDVATFYRRALQRMSERCAADAECREEHGDLAAHYDAALARLRAEPVIFELGEVDPDSDLVLSIDDRLFDGLLFDALYAGETRREIPAILRETAGGGSAAVSARLREYLSYASFDSDAVYLSHICHDEASFESPSAVAAAIAEAGAQAHMITEAWDSYLCEVWPAGRADTVESTPVFSTVPALLLAGEYDPVTPAALAYAAARHLPNGQVFELADAGHGLLYESACARRLMEAFLADPWRRPAEACEASQIIELAAQ